MAYTEKQITSVSEVIDKYTGTLDTYVQKTIKDVAKTKMTEGATDIEVADAVYDCINTSFCGNAVTAMMCQQICPKSVLLILRNEIIAALKK